MAKAVICFSLFDKCLIILTEIWQTSNAQTYLPIVVLFFFRTQLIESNSLKHSHPIINSLERMGEKTGLAFLYDACVNANEIFIKQMIMQANNK